MDNSNTDHLTGLNKLVADADYNRFSVISAILIFTGCLGGINVGVGGLSSTFQLIATVVPTMATLSLILSLAPMRLILGAAAIATIIDVILITINLV